MGEPAARLNERARSIALRAIRETCAYQGWILHAAHVRTNHVHIVIASPTDTSKLLQKLKTRISRALNDEFGKRQWWGRHGSTILLWNPHRVDDAVAYTWEQGVSMARYINPRRWQEYADSDI